MRATCTGCSAPIPQRKTSLLEFYIAQNYAGPGSQLDLDRLAWKQLTEHTLRATQATVDDMLRLDYDTFVNASFFLQGKADQFTQQRPGDRKRILGSILGLEIWESYRQRAAEQRKGVEAQMAALDGRLAEINAELAEEKDAPGAPERAGKRIGAPGGCPPRPGDRPGKYPQAGCYAERAAPLGEQPGPTGAGYRPPGRNAGRKAAGAAGRADHPAGYPGARWSKSKPPTRPGRRLASELERWEEVAERFREQEKRRQEPLAEINAMRARLEQERTQLDARQAEVEAEAAQLPALQAELEQARQAAVQEEEKLAERENLRAELDQANQRHADAKAENPRLKDEMLELRERIDRLAEAEGAECPLCGQPLIPQERQRLMEELEAQGSALKERYLENQDLMGQTQARVNDLQKQIGALSRAEKALQSTAQAIARGEAQLEQFERMPREWEQGGAPRG